MIEQKVFQSYSTLSAGRLSLCGHMWASVVRKVLHGIRPNFMAGYQFLQQLPFFFFTHIGHYGREISTRYCSHRFFHPISTKLGHRHLPYETEASAQFLKFLWHIRLPLNDGVTSVFSFTYSFPFLRTVIQLCRTVL